MRIVISSVLFLVRLVSEYGMAILALIDFQLYPDCMQCRRELNFKYVARIYDMPPVRPAQKPRKP